MIVTIVNQAGMFDLDALAENLARLRAHTGRTVLLLDTRRERHVCERGRTWKSPWLRPFAGRAVGDSVDTDPGRFKDLIIEADASNSPACRRALIAAQVVVVVLAPQADATAQHRLAARLRDAQMFNPGMRLLLACPATDGTCGASMLHILASHDPQHGVPAIPADLVQFPVLGQNQDAWHPRRRHKNGFLADESAMLYRAAFGLSAAGSPGRS